ncbi:MAG: 4-hydroxy-tetrahydrodipicolinate synthase [Bacillota bacterium]
MQLKGIIPAMLTPFNRDGGVDFGLLRTYVDFLIDRGVTGLFPTGTNGEGPALGTEERKKIAEAVVDQAGKRVPVIVQTGAITTAETIELTTHAQETGADAASVLPPFYFPHDEQALEAHYRAVAEAVPGFPIYLYNIPGNAKNDLKPGLVKRLVEACPNICGLKDSSKDMTRLEEYIDILGPDFTVLVGTDSLILPALVMGGAGVVSAVANVFPEPCVELYRAYLAGNLSLAREKQYLVNRLRSILKEGPYITPYRYALTMRGLPFLPVRPPFRPLTEKETERLTGSLRSLGLV